MSLRDRLGREWTEGRRNFCPYCDGHWSLAEAGDGTYGITHSMPICDSYRDMDSHDYYAEASKRVAS